MPDASRGYTQVVIHVKFKDFRLVVNVKLQEGMPSMGGLFRVDLDCCSLPEKAFGGYTCQIERIKNVVLIKVIETVDSSNYPGHRPTPSIPTP